MAMLCTHPPPPYQELAAAPPIRSTFWPLPSPHLNSQAVAANQASPLDCPEHFLCSFPLIGH